MPENPIKFQEVRDFGEIINATFAFLKENFQALAMLILIYNLPFIILTAILYGALPMFLGNGPIGNLVYSLIILAGSIIYSMVLITLVYQYIMLYIQHGNNHFRLDVVWESSLPNLGMILGTLVGYTILTMLGFLLLILPGIYWAICFSMVFIIRLHEGKDFSEARRRCFELLRGNSDSVWNNWFKLFGLLVITIVISLIITYTNQNILEMLGLTSEKILQKNLGSYSFMLAIVSLIETLMAAFLQTISIIALSFQYFSLVEERDSLDLRNQIETFGQNS
jgi:PAS domain-containing protein